MKILYEDHQALPVQDCHLQFSFLPFLLSFNSGSFTSWDTDNLEAFNFVAIVLAQEFPFLLFRPFPKPILGFCHSELLGCLSLFVDYWDHSAINAHFASF